MIFLDVLNKHAPVTGIKIKGNSLPYITSDIRKLIRQRDYLKKKANKTGSKYLWQTYQHLRNKVKYSIRTARANYYSNMFEEHQGDIKNTCKILNEIINKDNNKSTDTDCVIYNGETIFDNQILPETFNEHFISIGEKLAKDIPASSNDVDSYLRELRKVESRFKFKCIPPKDVWDILNKLKSGKASGMHMISNSILKISNSLPETFNESLSQQIFPDDFKVARVTPIHKGSERDDVGNYRHISILSTVARVFENIIYTHLYDYLMQNNILGDKQWGFRSLHSTALALLDCTKDWLINIDKGNSNFAVFLDIKKAFDMVGHEILLQKLKFYGIMSNELNFFKSYLMNRSQFCQIRCFKSPIGKVLLGVPQGFIIGPLLFIIYMNDLPHCIENGHVTMYADDTSASCEVKSVHDITVKVIPDLVKLCDWLKSNKLSLNMIKTEFMIIGSTQNVLKFGDLIAIRIDDQPTKQVAHVKYLGIIVDDPLTWKEHADYISKKISRNLGTIKRSRQCITVDSTIVLYRTLIKSYLRYCCNVWGSCGNALLHRLQTLKNRAVRVITNTSFENADHKLLLKRLNLLSVEQIIQFDYLCVIYKMVNDFAATNAMDLFQPAEKANHYETRSNIDGKFKITKTHRKKADTAFSNFGAKIWNGIPAEIREVLSFDNFKSKVKSYMLSRHERD